MTPLDDHLPAALQTLVDDQPPQPADRLGSVTRRATRIRRTRAAVSVAAVLALAAPVGVLLAHRSATSTSYAGSPVSGWPDRSQSANRDLATGALAHWVSDEGGSTNGLHWLYRGIVTMPDSSHDVAVAATNHQLTSHNGVFVGDAGPVTGPLTMTPVDGRGHPSVSVPLGFSGQEPQLTQPPAPSTPASFTLSSGMTGQLTAHGSTVVRVDFSGQGSGPRRIAFYAACYGGGTLTVTLDDKFLGRAPCGGSAGFSYGFTSQPKSPAIHVLTFTASQLVAFNVASGTVPA